MALASLLPPISATSLEVTQIDPPGADIAEAAGLNNNGTVVGWRPGSSSQQVFVYNHGMFGTSDAPIGADIYPVGISANGRIAARSYAGDHQITLVGDGTLAAISIAGATDLIPTAISADGEVVGISFNPGSITSDVAGFAYKDGTAVRLAVPGAISTVAAAISNTDTVVGYFDTNTSQQIFIYANNTYTTIDTPAGQAGSWAQSTRGYYNPVAVNDSGTIIGNYGDFYEGSKSFGLQSHAFIYNAGTFTTFDVPGAVATYVTAINDNGDIVGSYVTNDVSGDIGGCEF